MEENKLIMVPGIVRIVFRSVRFNKKPVLYQVLIIALLTAVITGSLMTGSSVRTSLRKSSSERLGNAGIIITSGVRYFDKSLADRMKESTGTDCTGLLEVNGYCQILNSQKGAFNTHIYAVTNDFFKFNGDDSVVIRSGEIAVNRKLANYLGVNIGDELIIRFKAISDIPSDAPFSSAEATGMSVAMRVGAIIEPDNSGNFSLSISQIMPMNIFMNLSDLKDINGHSAKINRLLIKNESFLSVNKIYSDLKHVLKLSDIGLFLRMIRKTGEYEMVSDRVFIAEELIEEIRKAIPSSAPVITYLGNKFKSGSRSTPYSFVSALPSSLYSGIPDNEGIVINRWLADDLNAQQGDSLEMSWYSPDSNNKLIEKSSFFNIKGIVEITGIWSDSLLMPDFPGISGRESCSDWDAGIPVKMDDIRRKDEDYWKKFKGTPKAFINYVKGKELWGNNFGPATSVRFPSGLSEKEIKEHLEGAIYPDIAGFAVLDLSNESAKAANESVDFGTLFLSLGFFMIIASVVLLSFAVSSYFNSKRGHVNVFFALGFQNRWIERLLFFESLIIALSGCLIGSLAGITVNFFITSALNSVWSGAVQTDTLISYFNIVPVLIGFSLTILFIMLFMLIKIKRYIRKLNSQEKEFHVKSSRRSSILFLLASAVITTLLFALTIILKNQELLLSFITGTVLLITLVLLCRFYFIGRIIPPNNKIPGMDLSHLYYSFYPSHAVTPILFIAAGIFAVFITGANRINFDEKHLSRSGGTGGYQLWCESTIPVKDDLNSISGKKEFGIDDEQLNDLHFIQMRRSSGDDASCLNLNHVTAPPLLGVDPEHFIDDGSFSFVKSISHKSINNPWEFLDVISENNVIYGIADQTVLEWGLKIKPGDTLVLRAENGQQLNIIIAAGLKSSVFQGYVLIGLKNFIKYYPSVSGSSVLLVEGNPGQTHLYQSALNERFQNNGINIELTTDRLASFYEVTNTYLSVFGVFGALGMITGIAGLGFVLLRNYNHRKREFALMLATGFSVRKIRRMILSEQMLILFTGITSGILSAIVATLPSLKSSPDIPWIYLIIMVVAIIITGITVLLFSVRSVTIDSLTSILRKE